MDFLRLSVVYGFLFLGSLLGVETMASKISVGAGEVGEVRQGDGVLVQLEGGICISVVAKVMNLRSGIKNDRWWGSCRLSWLGGSTDIWFDTENDFRGVVEGSVYLISGNGAPSREKGIRFYPKTFEVIL